MAESNPEMIYALRLASAQLKESYCVYMEQHEHAEYWGYPVLAKCFKKAAKWRVDFVERVQGRLEFFDQGIGDVDYGSISWPRHKFAAIIQADLDMETVIDKHARESKVLGLKPEIYDPVSANLFTKIARRSEMTIAKLQAALSVVDETSLKMWLQNANIE